MAPAILLRRQPRARLAAKRVRLATAHTTSEVEKLEGPWCSLNASGAWPTGQFSWLHACLSSFGSCPTCHVVAALHGENLSAVAPLIQKRIRGVLRLCPPGDSELCEPMAFAWSDRV